MTKEIRIKLTPQEVQEALFCWLKLKLNLDFKNTKINGWSVNQIEGAYLEIVDIAEGN